VNATRHLLIVDVETTGLDPQKDAPIEVGAILFDVEHRAITAQFSSLLPTFVLNGAKPVNGISNALLSGVGQPWERSSLRYLQHLHNCADAVLAHNAEFDRQWLLPVLSSDEGGLAGNWRQKPWICTMQDFRWNLPGLRATPSVVDLALAHGVPIWKTHRALTDCTYLAQVLATRQDLRELLLDAQKPTFLYVALVTYEERQLAKDAGFRWEGHGFLKAWTRYLREGEVPGLPFKAMAVTRPEELSVEFSDQFTCSP
jgi:DNA polymerase-3 subunit epsilon